MSFGSLLYSIFGWFFAFYGVFATVQESGHDSGGSVLGMIVAAILTASCFAISRELERLQAAKRNR